MKNNNFFLRWSFFFIIVVILKLFLLPPVFLQNNNMVMGFVMFPSSFSSSYFYILCNAAQFMKASNAIKMERILHEAKEIMDTLPYPPLLKLVLRMSCFCIR